MGVLRGAGRQEAQRPSAEQTGPSVIPTSETPWALECLTTSQQSLRNTLGVCMPAHVCMCVCARECVCVCMHMCTQWGRSKMMGARSLGTGDFLLDAGPEPPLRLWTHHGTQTCVRIPPTPSSAQVRPKPAVTQVVASSLSQTLGQVTAPRPVFRSPAGT